MNASTMMVYGFLLSFDCTQAADQIAPSEGTLCGSQAFYSQ